MLSIPVRKSIKVPRYIITATEHILRTVRSTYIQYIHTYIHTYKNTHTHTHTYIYIHTYIIYIHIYTC